MLEANLGGHSVEKLNTFLQHFFIMVALLLKIAVLAKTKPDKCPKKM
ncbi:hypothetical protein SAMN05216436_11469 [bacterium A37T11]|nr:hypothetical protein SAMN05216436_11469 [bacterium A37T11]